MPRLPFLRRASANDSDLVHPKEAASVVRRHSLVDTESPKLPPIPKVSPLLNPTDREQLDRATTATSAASSRYSAGSSSQGHHSDDSAGSGSTGGRRYGSADEGTVYTTATSVEEGVEEQEKSPVFAQRFMAPTHREKPAQASLPEAWFLPWLAPLQRPDIFVRKASLVPGELSPEEDDPALLEAERILLSTPEPTELPNVSTETLHIRPLSVGMYKRPSLPLPDLPTMRTFSSTRPPAAVFPARHAVARVPVPYDSDEDDGEETERENSVARPRVTVAAPPPPARPRPGQRRRPSKLKKKRRGSSSGASSGGETKPKKLPFDRFSFPTEEGLAKALECELATESGEAVTFGNVLRERQHEKVVVIFLRHAWCGLCQQYVEALNRASINLLSVTGTMFAGLDHRPTSSRFAPLDVVLINSSTPALIGPYRQRHHTPFPLYSDRHRKLYKALGMTRKTWDMGKDADKGSYIVKSQLQNVTSSISAGVKLPKYPGSQTQLGGEFVFEHVKESDTFKCLFVSRMHNTRAHAELRDVFAAAGIELDAEDAASVYGG
ncbi:hypothetical protein BMF94_3920 [Rhodotorula taiwanensis]|uniref:Thioredoxin domain-containing protein n=1 Tax=Rhodotorula taiwanensis TaxID=741276 RepID=A0A2S5B8H6_9BASI|nr:hypothetical protein BMF94_3920 [Rhodotorula taiwanensis]